MAENSRHAGGGQRAGATRYVVPLLIVAAFVAPGAWMISRLPPIPVAASLVLATASLWLLALTTKLIDFERPRYGIAPALAAVGVSVGASYVLGGSHAEALVYDLYGDMPLILWLTFPLVFLVGAGLRTSLADVRRGLGWMVGVGALLASVMAFQLTTTGNVSVFGSTAYTVPALACVIPVGFGLAATEARPRPRVALYAGAAIITAALGAASGSMMGTLAAVFAALVSVAVTPFARRGTGATRWMRWSAVAVAAVLFAGLIAAQVPAVSGRWASPDRFSAFDKNVITRAYLWEGAQAMLADRPLTGFGPSGYRLHAAEFLDPGIHVHGPGAQGDIDPVAYSPQSPHSVVWDIATRLGMLGVLAFLALGVAWAMAIRRLAEEDPPELAVLRATLAAAFISALFALLVNPPIFAIGLSAPVLAGLAVAPLRTHGHASDVAPRRQSHATILRATAGLLGGLILVTSVWLAVGGMAERGIAQGEALTEMAGHESVLDILPGYPPSVRRTLELALLIAPDDAAVAKAQAAVDDAPAHVTAFAPNIPSLVAHSLAQADRTGRTDVSWERTMLDRADAVLPDIPSLAAERLHLELIEGDRSAVAAVLPEARSWSAAYALAPGYIERAEAYLGSGQ